MLKHSHDTSQIARLFLPASSTINVISTLTYTKITSITFNVGIKTDSLVWTLEKNGSEGEKGQNMLNFEWATL